MKSQRKLPPGVVGNLVAKDRHKPPAAGVEIGWLTPIKASASGGGYWSFRCRCGELVLRLSRNVRSSAEAGNTPKCDTCNRVRREAAAP